MYPSGSARSNARRAGLPSWYSPTTTLRVTRSRLTSGVFAVRQNLWEFSARISREWPSSRNDRTSSVIDRSRQAESILGARPRPLALSTMIVVAPRRTIAPSRFSNSSSFGLYVAVSVGRPSRRTAITWARIVFPSPGWFPVNRTAGFDPTKCGPRRAVTSTPT